MDILILKEKYIHRHIDISTEEKKKCAFLAIVEERYNYGWYNPMFEEPIKPEYYDDLSNVPEDFLQQAKDNNRCYDTSVKYYNQEQKFIKVLNKALEGDYHAASAVLSYRSSAEYEDYEIVKLENPLEW